MERSTVPTVLPRTRAVGRRAVLALLVGAVAAASAGAVLVPARSARAELATAIEDVVVRAEPAADAPVLIVVATDLGLTVEGRARDGYYPVSFAGIEGWAATGSLATAVDGATGPAGSAGNGRGTVRTGEDLNLRADASEDAAVVLVVAAGEAVVPTGGQRDGYVEVDYAGTTGWVLGEHLVAAAPAADRDPRDFTEAEIIQIIYEAADYYGQPREDMLRVARCESELVPTAVNRVTGDYGLFQFRPSTWLSTPYGEYDIFDPRASAYAAGWMWSVGRRNEWVCQ